MGRKGGIKRFENYLHKTQATDRGHAPVFRLLTQLHINYYFYKGGYNLSKSNVHKLHKAVAECIKSYDLPKDCELLRDPACGGDQNIPLFSSDSKSRATRYSVVDMIILKDEKIKVIIEIEESDRTPIRICGKFLASALSKYFIHEFRGNKPIEMDKSVTFIQVCSTKNLKPGSAKEKQWVNLKDSINTLLESNNLSICRYELLPGKPKDFKKNKCEDLLKIIRKSIGQ